MGLYGTFIWPLLRQLDPEASHDMVLRFLSLSQRVPMAARVVQGLLSFQDPRLEFTWRGLTFRNPVGLAAGADKNGRVANMLYAIGLGFVEIGTVTPEPQAGNPKPRVFRALDQQALVNRLGFPSVGAEAVARNLSRVRLSQAPLGINIGKNASTPLDQAASDYLRCLEALHRHADYFVVNVSSPNTEGLRSLQAKPALTDLLQAILAKRRELAEKAGSDMTPLLLKISPDLSEGELSDIVQASLDADVDGIVAVNTSVDPALRDQTTTDIPGGISGRPLRQRALHTIETLRRMTPSDFLLVGVGGIFDAEDTWIMLQSGANAVQLYTGLIYRGPGAVSAINRGLVHRLEANGLTSLAQAAGGAGS